MVSHQLTRLVKMWTSSIPEVSTSYEIYNWLKMQVLFIQNILWMIKNEAMVRNSK
jgi:hypothetical protein